MADFPWCRLYNDILNDRKLERVRRMTKLPRFAIRGAFMTMIAMANDSPQRGYLMWSPGVWVGDDEIADDLEMEPVDFDALLAALLTLQIVTRLDHGGLRITNFDKRQFKSDLSTRRVQDHRASKAKKAKAANETPDPASYATPGNNAETLPERYGNASDTDTDTDTDVTETDTDTDTDTNAPPAIETQTITPGPEPQTPPTLTREEINAYLDAPDPVLQEHWQEIMAEVAGQVTQGSFQQTYGALLPLTIRDGTAILWHPTGPGADVCRVRLRKIMPRTVRGILHQPLHVAFMGAD